MVKILTHRQKGEPMDDDLISRKILLKKLRQHKELFCRNRIEFLGLSKNDKARVDEIDSCIATVINMPSAQPETNCSEIPNASDVVSRKAVREMVATWSYDMAELEDMELALHDVDELPPVSAERQRGKDNE
jgi:hypothetical protein